jgi:pimeloyl-ACP methyl ester carboxylesterase
MSPSRRTLALAATLLLLAAPAFAAPERVQIETDDGLTIVGDLYATGKKGAPAVVALHMYRSDRSAFAPLAAHLTKAGIDFLAIDMRGHGESAVQGEEDLSERVEARDATLFNAMHQDALAAVDYLIARGSDGGRIGLIGASVGCSVAIDAAVRRERIRAVAVMTPGKDYLGVPTMEHLANFGRRDMLILTSTSEADAGATAIDEVLGTKAHLHTFPKRTIHGTKMFGKVKGVEGIISEFFAHELGAPVALDGKPSPEETANFVITETLQIGEAVLTAELMRKGNYLYARLRAVRGELPAQFMVAFRQGPPKGGRGGGELRAAAVVGYEREVGVRHLLFREGSWFPARIRRAPHVAETGGARGEVAELLIPVYEDTFMVDPIGGFRVAFAVGAADVSAELTWFGKAKPGDPETWRLWPGK